MSFLIARMVKGLKDGENRSSFDLTRRLYGRAKEKASSGIRRTEYTEEAKVVVALGLKMMFLKNGQ